MFQLQTTTNAMKKARKYIIVATALLLSATVNAQIFLMSEEEMEHNLRCGYDNFSEDIFVPIQGLDMDQSFTPVGSGLWVLGCLGGAYLLGKRRKKDEE